MRQYGYSHDLKLDEYLYLRRAVDWPALPPDQAASGLAHSALVIACRHEGGIAGCARLLWDHGFIAYLAELIVLPEHQNQGLGKAMLLDVINWLEARRPPAWQIKIVLLSLHGKESFYERFGFRSLPAGIMGAGMDLVLDGSKSWEKPEANP